MKLGHKIYELRTAKNLSQGDLADLLDVSRQSVSKWETDSATPDLGKLIRLCDIFEISLDELTGRKQKAVPSAPVSIQSTAFTARQVIGYILLTISFLTTLTFIFLAAELPVFILIVQPLLLCSLICLFVKRQAGYWCIWAIYLSAEFFASFVVGLSLLKNTLFIRYIFIIFMIFVSWAMFRGVKFSVPKKRGCLILLGWVLYLAFSWLLPRFFYIFPTHFWFSHIDKLQMYLYYLSNAILTAGLAFLFRDTICFLRSRKNT